MWFRSQGSLRYYPWGDWWVIMNCCEELLRYYRTGAERQLGMRLQKPKHGAHISVVRGEGEPKNKDRWFYKDGELVSFEYSTALVFGETHVWLPVRSEELVKLRTRLGLTEQPPYGFHLTVGRYT